MRMNDPSPRVLVLANLGTPGAPTAPAVSAYLDEFLSDPRVVQLPRWLWRPLLRRVILPRRSPVVAGKYASIWMDGGSPLAVHTRGLAQAVQERLPRRKVVHAMRYGAPALAQVLRTEIAAGAREIRVLPLYPQYSTTTTASVADAIAGVDAGDARIDMLDDYHLHPAWIRAVADSIRAHWQAHGRGERLLLSFHGLPQRVVDAGDPYAVQCEASAAAIARELGLGRGDIELAYQSRFGAGRWLQPSTDARLLALRHHPGLEGGAAIELDAVEEGAAERLQGRGQDGLRRAVEILVDRFPDSQQIDIDVAAIERNALAVRVEPFPSLVVDQRAQLREAPAQRSARIVGQVPEHLAELVARMSAARDRQIGEERPRLLRLRQRQGGAVPRQLHPAQDPKCQHDISFALPRRAGSPGGPGRWPIAARSDVA